MNIVHVVDSMEMGGAEKLTALFCRMQRERGHVASVHCLYTKGVLGDQLEADGIEVMVHGPRSFFALMWSLYAGFRKSIPDVVHCHNATAAIIAALPARRAGVRTVIATRHGLVSRPYQLRQGLKFAVASIWCDWIVGVCKQTRTNLLAAPFAARRKIIHVYNGAAPASRSSAPQQKDGFTLLCVGRLAPPKDHANLLRSFAIVHERHPRTKLWIVGDGPLHSALRQMADSLGLNESVTFWGEKTDVSPFLRGADLLVMSSVTEGLPLSLLEAMSVGLPAVVTDVGGMGEVARLVGTMRTVPPSDPTRMADALCDAITHRDNLGQLGSDVRNCYEQNFTPGRMVDQYMRLYGAVSGAEESPARAYVPTAQELR
jgi:glycosyltransferase involved in cell wall biosynthesis